MNHRYGRNRRSTARVLAAILSGVCLAFFAGCTDEVSSTECGAGQSYSNIEDRCVSDNGDGDGGQNSDSGGGEANSGANSGANSDANGGDNSGNNGDEDTGPPCEGLECDQVTCDADEAVTTLTGTVTVPSGALPLPNVTVFVPNGPLEPIEDGASCQRCEDMISGDPLVQTVTDFKGEFVLENVPAGEDIPLVVQTGKWRRMVEIPAVDACEVNEITDTEYTRLPRNRDEGDIPRIAVTNSMWDALECLITRLGIEEAEFSEAHDDEQRVTLMTHDSGAAQFAPGFRGGASLMPANQWWDDLSNLQEYDMLVYSCGYPNASAQAQEALQQYVDQGGRVFMNDLHREWFEFGTGDFQAVANWQTAIWPPEDQMLAELDTSVPGGGQMFDWMDHLGRFDVNNQFPVNAIVKNIGSVNQDQAERWIYTPEDSPGDLDLYFAFNTPLGAADGDQCGRVVYSDLHIVSAGDSEEGEPFPDNCSDGPLSVQEEALIYMIFDLSACLAPECTPLNCSDVPNGCGVHDNGCGKSLDCGECCVDEGQSCDADGDCCESLWCGDDGTCTDECRRQGDPCTATSQCCSTSICTGSGGEEGVCLAQ